MCVKRLTCCRSGSHAFPHVLDHGAVHVALRTDDIVAHVRLHTPQHAPHHGLDTHALVQLFGLLRDIPHKHTF